jgi:hypothetical protein
VIWDDYRMKAAVLAAGLVMLAGCSPSHERFDSGQAVAEAVRDSGIPCDYRPDEELTGFLIQIPKGESWGQCDGLAIYVLGNNDALQRLKEGQAVAADDTPRLYWVYGDNWFIATEYPSLRDRVAKVLGGESTDNTRL